MFKAVSKFSGTTFATGHTQAEVIAMCKGFGVPRNQYSVKGPKARTVSTEIAKHNATVWVGM